MLMKFHMIVKLSGCINEYLLIGVFDVCKKASGKYPKNLRQMRTFISKEGGSRMTACGRIIEIFIHPNRNDNNDSQIGIAI